MAKRGSTRSGRSATRLFVLGLMVTLLLSGFAGLPGASGAARGDGPPSRPGPAGFATHPPMIRPSPFAAPALVAPAYESRQFDLLTGATAPPGAPVPDELGSSYYGPAFVTYDPLSGDLLVLGSGSMAWYNTTSDSFVRWTYFGETGGPSPAAGSALNPYEVAVDTTDGLDYVTHSQYAWSCGAGCAGDYVSVVNDSTGTIVRTVGGGPELSGIAYDPGNDRVYVAGTSSNRVEVLNGSTSAVVGYIPGGVGPQNLAVDAANGEVYVADSGNATITEINATNGTVRTTIPLRNTSGLFDIVLDPTDQRLFVDGAASVVAAVNVSNDRERYTTPVRSGPAFLAWDPLNDTVEVGATNSQLLSVVNASSTGRPTAVFVSIGDVGGAVAYDPADRSVFATTVGYSCQVVQLNASTQVVGRAQPVSLQASAAAFDPSNDRLYAGDVLGPNYWIENVSSATALPIVREFRTSSLVYDSVDGTVLTEGVSAGEVGEIYATNDTLGPNLTSPSSYDGAVLGYDPSSDALWVWQGCGGTYCTSDISKYDANNGTWRASIGTSQYENDISMDPAGHRLFYSGSTYGYYSGYVPRVAAINTSNDSPIWSIAPGYPVDLAYDPLDGNVWVENQYPSNITLYNASTGAYDGNVSWTFPGTAAPIVYDAAARAMFAATQAYPNGTIVDQLLEYNASTHALLGTIAVDGNLSDLAVDPSNGTLYGVSYGVTATEIVLGDALHVVSFSAAPRAVDLGSTARLNVSVAGGAPGAYTYSYLGLPSGCASANSSLLLCVPSSAGTYPIQVAVTDSNGSVARSNLTLLVVPRLTVGTLTAAPGEVALGSPVNLTANASGGYGGYAFTWSGLPRGCSPTASPPLGCVPTVGGVFNVSLSVEDAAGTTLTAGPVTLEVRSPIHAHLFVSRRSLDIGTTVNLTAVVQNATASDSYLWGGLPNGCTSQNATELSCTPTANGSFAVNVTVDDSFLGATRSNVVTLTVDPALSAVSLAVSRTVVDVGQLVTFWANVSGGSGGYTVQWFGVPSSCPSGQGSPLTCRLTAPGTYAADALVNDSVGGARNGSAPLVTVDPRPSITALAASRVTLDLGQSVWFNATGSAPAGGAVWAWTGLPSGCAGANVPNLDCTPNGTGAFAVVANLTDATGAGSLADPEVSVLVFAGLSVNESIPIAASVPLGSTLSFAATVTGGSGGLGYAWSLPAGCPDSTTASATCALTTPGGETVSVTVTDSDGASATSPAVRFQVLGGALLGTAVTASRATVDAGTSLTLYANVSGGVAPYSYAWSNLPLGCPAADQPTITCHPTEVGTYAAYAEVADAAGDDIGLAPTLVDVVAGPSIGIGLVSPGPNVTAGGSVTLAASVGGGVGPFTIHWTLNGAPAGSGPNLTVPIPSAGTYRFHASVADALGATNSSDVLLVLGIASSYPTTSSTGPAIPPWAGLVAGVVIGASVGAAWLLGHRRRAPGSPAPPPADADPPA